MSRSAVSTASPAVLDPSGASAASNRLNCGGNAPPLSLIPCKAYLPRSRHDGLPDAGETSRPTISNTNTRLENRHISLRMSSRLIRYLPRPLSIRQSPERQERDAVVLLNQDRRELAWNFRLVTVRLRPTRQGRLLNARPRHGRCVGCRWEASR